MENNISFNGLNKIFRYNEDTYGFVTNWKIEVGEPVPISSTEKGQVITRDVAEIIEQRKSRGVFGEGFEIPTWYKVRVQ